MPRIVRVALPVPLFRLFDYLLEAGLAEPVPGCRVRVPFAGRTLTGVVLECTDTSAVPAGQLKPVAAILDTTPLLGDELMRTVCWAARYYQHAIGEAFEAALPVLMRGAGELPAAGVDGFELSRAGQSALADPRRRCGSRTAALLEILADGPQSSVTLDERLPGWRAACRSLRARGWVAECRLEGPLRADGAVAAPALNADQQAAVEAIRADLGRFAPILIEGVTGSGKTEVYLAAIAETIARGRQALVLVPEIALTPQTTRRFRERLGFDIAVLHSGLSERERAKAWLAAARGEARVILGTRSAIFVPLPLPGLIIVDEEHDASYKQQDGFRYHARDLAVVRAKALDVPLLLGSATPSLESLANAEAGRYRRLGLPQRAGVARPPSLQVMDLRNKRLEQGLAVSTLQVMQQHLARGEQVLVFRNRRGYAPVLFCHGCGWTAQCARCDRPLTLHRGAARLRCHHCGAQARIPPACPQCASPALAPQGQGTERIEEVLRERFPDVPVLRVDRDTTRNRGGRELIFEQLDADGARILVGTQMLAKGHDLPGLTLVVVAGVDEGLHSVDFRAAERLGQLIVQVAGRAGRADRAGSVILQTHQPDHPLLRDLIEGGYPALARTLMHERRAASLPPFGHFALLRAEAKAMGDAEGFLAEAVEAAGAHAPQVSAHGPLPAPMPRRAGFQRSQVIIEAAERSAMQAFLPDWLASLRGRPSARRVRWSIDVDPVEMG
ncbi:primosomal protein N' [Dokdonella immobilis]|uniref:Replication restart protein PriA n=1 Tax=Dokdonella immobilis TaxID=578942 RepID=A0A1I4VJM9_9GAMM|nr:primosomal protein N' [Dokdonella immobilis]SFN01339.1 replication restart DNA helicase PriA [Dokdonella immobilis]